MKLLRTFQILKIFGKKEIEINRKQLNGERLTQSEKNRLSRDIRQKLNFIEKLELREKFDIPRDAFVVLMTSRNQLRKEFILLMEGYAQFKKQWDSQANKVARMNIYNQIQPILDQTPSFRKNSDFFLLENLPK